ncbi:Putative Tudor domain-containing protein [Septoria linicola]|uniref:Tudor domain-containing protein n=1 Tax=Septoria linicola TaxID=215465 RepID=A0A9Q9APA0_9PEZI|nr:putative Tudor domain-containing protein [Septoria linicola]USW48341.1 Putative Tudor domain-containing protein [Septoria linicola]
MSELAGLEEELAQAQEFVDTCKEALELDPDDADVKADMASFQQQIPVLKSKIAALKTQKVSAPSPSSGGAPKYDMSKHPKFQKPTTDTPPPPPAEDNRASFNVGDTVQAKYSADKSWYPATIVSKTGSPSDPVYTVKFKGYDEKEQKRKHEVRAVENKKRKADGTPVAPAAAAVPPPPMVTAPVQHGTVISAAPSIDPTLVQKREPSKVSDGPTRMPPAPKKLKGNKTLEKSKSSWNDWQKSGPKKPAIGGATKLKKDSQFRTPDLPNAKVGFTGSGKGMSKDQARAKWNFAQDDNPDE